MFRTCRSRSRRWRLIVVGLCSAAFALSGCGEKSGSPEKPPQESDAPHVEPVKLTDENFDELTGKGVVLVDFWATWCHFCKMQEPIIHKIAAEYEGRVVVGKLDTDASKKTARRFKITGLPTLIVFKDGQRGKPLVGLQSEAQLRAALDAALGQ